MERSRQHGTIGQRGFKAHAVGACVQSGELIVAGAISRSRAHGDATAVVERDGHAFDAGLTDILLEVAVQIEPHEVADAGLRIEVSKVDVGLVLADAECDRCGLAGASKAVAVQIVITALVRRGDGQAVDELDGHTHAVGAGIKVAEVVVADGIRDGRANSDAAAVIQGDRHVLDTGFAWVLDAIAVEVLPDEAADAALR